MRYHERRTRSKGFNVIAGIDEAGRGPLAGPVVAACVILNKKRFSSPIRDSKVLSPKQRDAAYKEITRSCAFSVGIVDEKAIDDINILQATILAMEETVRRIEPVPDFVLVDGKIRLNIGTPHKGIKGGDAKSITIAAASIVAKVTRDKIMTDYDRQYPEYGFARHKGYPTRDHIATLKRFGPSPIHRRTFGPVANCI